MRCSSIGGMQACNCSITASEKSGSGHDASGCAEHEDRNSDTLAASDDALTVEALKR
jgi:hypothetical protein